MKLFVRLTFIFLLAVACQPSLTESERWQQTAKRITIYRDQYGVPHIYAKTDADAVFGMLYAQCEDDFARVEQNYLWATGRLAEVEGEEMLYSDLRARLFLTEDEAKAHLINSPQWLQALCQAFADGINYYLFTHPEVKPRLLTRFEPWMPFYFSEGSIGGDIERVSTNKIKEFYEKAADLTMVPAYNEPDDILKEPTGSNGIAISGQLTQSGNAMLLINPHTSFYFRGEMHVISEEGLNAYGAVTWGQFFIYQGFNEKCGWMHTSSYADVIDEFVQTITEVNGEFYYLYGDEQRKVDVIPVAINVKTAQGMETKKFDVYRTHHGPITHLTDDRHTATALNWQPVAALSQSFLRTKMKGYDDLLDMMQWKANSSNNTVYADAVGNIGYFHSNFIPRRDTSYNYNEPIDGSDPAADWQGLHDVDELIQLKNPANGWIQNCNSTPFTAAAEASPKNIDYPAYMAPEPENFRGVHAIRVLTNRSGYTLDSLLKIAYDPYLPAFEQLIPGLIQAWHLHREAYKDLETAIMILKDWDFTTGETSKGMTLGHYYLTHYLRNGNRPTGLNMMEIVQYYGTSSPERERLDMLRNTVSRLRADFGTESIAWGEVNRLQRLDGRIQQRFDDEATSIPIGFASGNWGALASYGARGNQGTKKIYGTYGNSFVAVVEFGPKVKAKSILAGGQSSDPNSPHFWDQAVPYAQVAFKDVLFYREDVAHGAKRKYRPGEK